MPSREGTHDLASFGPEVLTALRAGVPLLIPDVEVDPRTSDPDTLRAFEAIDTRAAITASLVKDGRMRAAIYVHAREPRPWSRQDAELVVDVAERIWSSVERVKAEAALSASESFARSILESSGDCIKVLDLDGRVLSMNGPGRSLMAIENLETIIGKDWDSLWPVEERVTLRNAMERARAGEAGRFMGFCPTAAGEPRWWDVAVTAIAGEGGAPAGLLVVSRDITDQRRADDALRESEGRFRELVERAPEKMWVNQPDGSVAYFNAAWRDYTGQPRVPEGLSWAQAIHPDDRTRLAECRAGGVATGEAYELEVRIRRESDGAWRWHVGRVAPVRSDGRIFAWVGMAADIDDVRRAQHTLSELNASLESRVIERTEELQNAHEQLRQSQKMEAIGQLTGGLAHDLNNMLTVITGNMDMARRNLAAGDEARVQRAITNALKGAEGAGALTRRLLAFARRQPLSPKTVSAADLIDGMSDLLARALGETVLLRVHSTPDLHAISVDPDQLENAILNLAVNARDAMPAGGSLTIAAANVAIDRAAARQLELVPGDHVEVAVTDTGMGMPAEVVARVFEPFYTTKEQGKGTGLGLSMVYGFTKQSEGSVAIDSRSGEGTTVRLFFPAKERAIAESSEHPPPERRGSETILLVEDQEEVADLAESILADAGYRVLRASTGDEAMKRFDDWGSFDLLFTDVVMPGTLSGVALAREMRRRRPDVPVLVTSGYSAESIQRAAEFPMLGKPYRRGDLLARVRQVLDGTTTAVAS